MMLPSDDSDEDITGLIEKPIITYDLPPMYQSKYRESIKSAVSMGKSAHKSLGVPKVPLKSPSDFLKKNSRIELRPSTEISHKHYHRPDYQHKLPSWEPIKRSKSTNEIPRISKNFKEENILNVSQSKIKKHEIHSIKSNNQLGQNSLVIKSSQNSIKKQPKIHLETNINSKIDQSTEIKSSLADSAMTMSQKTSWGKKITSKTSIRPSSSANLEVKNPEKTCHRVTDDERKELLAGMKKKWDEMMKQFQTLPFLADTPPKAKRKAKIEEDLKQLERDIDMIERHPYIYVYNDDEK